MTLASRHLIERIVVGVDGSEQGGAALNWAMGLARETGAEIVAVFAIAPVSYAAYGGGFGLPMVPPELDPEWRAGMQREFEDRWCQPLAGSGLRYRTVIEDGRPAGVIAAVAAREDADLVVVGRRGHREVTELLLGSVSHELSHHCSRPVLLISGAPTSARVLPLAAGRTV